MSLPNFTAAAAVYTGNGFYRTGGTATNLSGEIIPQQTPSPIVRNCHCGPCYRDAGGACVKDCLCCAGPICTPENSREITVNCSPNQCSPLPPCCPPGCRIC